jgi:hypothetical protein
MARRDDVDAEEAVHRLHMRVFTCPGDPVQVKGVLATPWGSSIKALAGEMFMVWMTITARAAGTAQLTPNRAVMSDEKCVVCRR